MRLGGCPVLAARQAFTAREGDSPIVLALLATVAVHPLHPFRCRCRPCLAPSPPPCAVPLAMETAYAARRRQAPLQFHLMEFALPARVNRTGRREADTRHVFPPAFKPENRFQNCIALMGRWSAAPEFFSVFGGSGFTRPWRRRLFRLLPAAVPDAFCPLQIASFHRRRRDAGEEPEQNGARHSLPPS